MMSWMNISESNIAPTMVELGEWKSLHAQGRTRNFSLRLSSCDTNILIKINLHAYIYIYIYIQINLLREFIFF